MLSHVHKIKISMKRIKIDSKSSEPEIESWN